MKLLTFAVLCEYGTDTCYKFSPASRPPSGARPRQAILSLNSTFVDMMNAHLCGPVFIEEYAECVYELEVHSCDFPILGVLIGDMHAAENRQWDSEEQNWGETLFIFGVRGSLRCIDLLCEGSPVYTSGPMRRTE